MKKVYKVTKIVNDAQISQGDELFPLIEKYGVKIGRSSQEKSIYIWKNRKNQARIGHAINFSKEKGNRPPFNKSLSEISNDLSYDRVEKFIKKIINKL